MKYLTLSLLVILVLIISVFAIINHKKTKIMDQQNSKYGEIISFKRNEELQFSDFSVLFLGTTNQKVEFNPNLNFVYYNFEIKDLDSRKRSLSWSSGAGEISPEIFVVKNKVYQLELKHSQKDNKWLKDNEIVISASDIEVSRYIFQIIARLSFFQKYTLNALEDALGLTFVKTENSNQYFDILNNNGFSPFNHAEIRINKNNIEKKLLILDVDSNINIPYKMILDHYPQAQLSVNSPNDPTHTSLVVPESWGKISFGFDKSNILTSIVFDSAE